MTEMVVLNLTKTRDSSAVIHTLSKEFGKRSFLISIPGKGNLSAFMPLSIIEGEIVENKKSDLWRARNFTIKYGLFGIRNDIRKNPMTMFLSEVLFKTISDGASEEGLFDWCKKMVLTLDTMEQDYANFHLLFLIELAGLLGFAPSAEDLVPFAGKHLAIVRKLCESSFSEAMLIPLNGETRNEIADILIKYISYHSESAINIKSLKVLRELFA